MEEAEDAEMEVEEEWGVAEGAFRSRCLSCGRRAQWPSSLQCRRHLPREHPGSTFPLPHPRVAQDAGRAMVEAGSAGTEEDACKSAGDGVGASNLWKYVLPAGCGFAH
jgi:hypothetical protein